MIRLAVLFIAVACTLTAQAETPLIKLLESAPEVRKVERHGRKPQPQDGQALKVIVHIRDWHWVPLEYVAAELPQGTDSRVVRAHYDRFLKSVRKVQDEQYRLLKRLADAGYDTVYRESLTPDVEPVFRIICRTLWNGRKAIPESGPELLKMPNILAIGAPGRLLAESKVKRIRALDTDETLRLTEPLDDNGTRRNVTREAREKREDHMVKTALTAKDAAVVVLGGAHDLSDNVNRLSPGNVILIVVTTKQYSAVNNEDR